MEVRAGCCASSRLFPCMNDESRDQAVIRHRQGHHSQPSSSSLLLRLHHLFTASRIEDRDLHREPHAKDPTSGFNVPLALLLFIKHPTIPNFASASRKESLSLSFVFPYLSLGFSCLFWLFLWYTPAPRFSDLEFLALAGLCVSVSASVLSHRYLHRNS